MPIDREILAYIAAHPGAGRSAIGAEAAPDVSATTVWRALKRLVGQGKLAKSGNARATVYFPAGAEAVRAHLRTPWNRRPPVAHNPEFLDRYLPNKTFYLGENERCLLHEAGRIASRMPAEIYARRILEKLLLDMSWASSRLEGNTYDLLDTEQLIRFGKEAKGKERREAVMILNHKEAIQYVVDHLDSISVRRADLFNLHALLSGGLLFDPAMAGSLRRMPAGISDSSYSPPDNRFAIGEEFDILIHKAAAIADPFEQSFFLLVHIPYLQAFVDVNKRTSRVASNIPLLQSNLAPMSFLTIERRDYIDGLFGVYELNDVSLLRDAYTEAYRASARNYRLAQADADPAKAALAYRDFVREAVRHCVLEWRAFAPEQVAAMAAGADIPPSDRDGVVEYVGREFAALHEGNAIRYRLSPADLASLPKTEPDRKAAGGASGE